MMIGAIRHTSLTFDPTRSSGLCWIIGLVKCSPGESLTINTHCGSEWVNSRIRIIPCIESVLVFAHRSKVMSTSQQHHSTSCWDHFTSTVTVTLGFFQDVKCLLNGHVHGSGRKSSDTELSDSFYQKLQQKVLCGVQVYELLTEWKPDEVVDVRNLTKPELALASLISVPPALFTSPWPFWKGFFWGISALPHLFFLFIVGFFLTQKQICWCIAIIWSRPMSVTCGRLYSLVWKVAIFGAINNWIY